MNAEVFVEWVARAVVVATVGAVTTLFVRLRRVEAENAVIEETVRQIAGSNVGEELHKLRLCIAESYVRRDDYVQQLSLIQSKLDSLGTLVARVDERTRNGG